MGRRVHACASLARQPGSLEPVPRSGVCGDSSRHRRALVRVTRGYWVHQSPGQSSLLPDITSLEILKQDQVESLKPCWA